MKTSWSWLFIWSNTGCQRWNTSTYIVDGIIHARCSFSFWNSLIVWCLLLSVEAARDYRLISTNKSTLFSFYHWSIRERKEHVWLLHVFQTRLQLVMFAFFSSLQADIARLLRLDKATRAIFSPSPSEKRRSRAVRGGEKVAFFSRSP